MSNAGLTEPNMTVIIATRDRPGALSRCINRVVDQQFSGRFEIIVVDDGSRAEATVAQLVDRTRDARLVRLPGKGISAARNAGVAAARAGFVCFTDDDCVPELNWIEVIHSSLTDGAAVVVGRTVNGDEHSSLAAASQIVSNAIFDNPVEPAAPASNLGCRREVTLTVKFDEEYAGMGAEERDWYVRVRTAGYAVKLEPRALVRHLPPPSLTEFLRRHARYGRGAYRFRRTHRGGRLERPSFYANLIRSGFRESIPTGLAVCLAQVATGVGFLRELLLHAD